MSVRLAVIGAGFMAQAAHLRCFQQAGGAEVVALASGRPQLRRQVAQRFGIPREYDSWQDVAAAADIDAAVVLLPPEYNPAVCCGLLTAGKHVFAEKPMALSLAQAQRMAQAAAAADRILMMGFMKRYDSGVQRARQLWAELVESGELGAVISARAWCLLGGNWTANIDRLVPVLRTEEPQSAKPVADCGPEWLPERLAAGMPGWGSDFYFFNHVHSHNVNLLRHFLGDEWEVTYADLRRKAKIAHLAYGETLATLEVGTGASAYAFEEGLKIYCEGGWLEVLPPPPLQMQAAAAVRLYRGGEVMTLSEPLGEWDWSFRRQAQEFVDCVRTGRQPVSSAAASVGDLALVEAIFRRAVELGNI